MTDNQSGKSVGQQNIDPDNRGITADAVVQKIKNSPLVAGTIEAANAMRDLILATLDDDKAEDVLAIDLAGKSPMADSMIIASGRSQRHVSALADHLSRRLKEAGFSGLRMEGQQNADWVLLDAGDVICHIFRPEVRSFYALERIWGEGATGHAKQEA